MDRGSLAAGMLVAALFSPGAKISMASGCEVQGWKAEESGAGLSW